MGGDTNDRLAMLEPWSSTLFLVAGALFLIAAANNSLQIVIDGYDPATISVPFLLVGLVAAFVGISGLYSRLRQRSPKLAGLSLGVIALAFVGVIVLLIWAIANYSGLASEPAPPLALGTLALMILGFVLAGITVIQTETYPGRVGILLVIEAIALVFVFAGPALFQGDPPQWFGAVIEGFQALLLLGIGTTLRGHTQREGTEATPDTAVR